MRAAAAIAPPVWPAFVAGGVAVVIWGATPAATEFAVHRVDPLTVGVLRTVLAVPLALAVILWRRLPGPQDAGEWGLQVAAGFGGFGGFTLLFTLGLSMTSTAHAALILAAVPVVTGLVSAAFDRRLPSRRWWLGAAIAFVGEAVLIGVRTPGPVTAAGSVAGDLLCVAATVFAGIGYVTGSRLAPHRGSWSVMFWGVLLAGAAQLPLLVVLPGPTAAGPVGWAAIAYLTLFSAVLAYAAWYWALARGGVTRIATLQFAQPLVSLVLAVALFAEPMTPPLVAAAALILAGITVARRG